MYALKGFQINASLSGSLGPFGLKTNTQVFIGVAGINDCLAR